MLKTIYFTEDTPTSHSSADGIWVKLQVPIKCPTFPCNFGLFLAFLGGFGRTSESYDN